SVGVGRWPVGRLLTDLGCGHQATLGPALVVVGRHDREDAHLANPPDSISALGESVLDHVDAERRGAGGVVAEHVEHDTARARLSAVRRYSDEEVEDQPVVQLTVAQTLWTRSFVESADAREAFIDADIGQFENRVAG